MRWLDGKHERIDSYRQDGYCVDSDDPFSSESEEDFVEVADSEDSEEFVKKADGDDWLTTHEERWIGVYTEVLDVLKTREDDGYTGRVDELKDQILYTIRDAFTQGRNREKTNY